MMARCPLQYHPVMNAHSAEPGPKATTRAEYAKRRLSKRQAEQDKKHTLGDDDLHRPTRPHSLTVSLSSTIRMTWPDDGA